METALDIHCRGGSHSDVRLGRMIGLGHRIHKWRCCRGCWWMGRGREGHWDCYCGESVILSFLFGEGNDLVFLSREGSVTLPSLS